MTSSTQYRKSAQTRIYCQGEAMDIADHAALGSDAAQQCKHYVLLQARSVPVVQHLSDVIDWMGRPALLNQYTMSSGVAANGSPRIFRTPV